MRAPPALQQRHLIGGHEAKARGEVHGRIGIRSLRRAGGSATEGDGAVMDEKFRMAHGAAERALDYVAILNAIHARHEPTIAMRLGAAEPVNEFYEHL